MPRNQNWLAKFLGVSQPRVSELLKDPDWRWPRKNWSDRTAGEIRQWLNRRRGENNATADRMSGDDVTDEAAGDVLGSLKKDPVKIAKLRKLIEETALIKLNRGLKEGNYVLKADVEDQHLQRIEAVKLKMQQIPLRSKDLLALFHAAAVKHADLKTVKAMEAGLEARLESQLTGWMKEICNAFSRGE